MIDFTILQANPIPPSISELQMQNEILQRKNKVFEKFIYGAIAVGVITLIYYVIKDAETKNKQQE